MIPASTYSHPDAMRDQVTIVTGAARGVGKGIAAALLERGAAVLLVDILDDVLSATTAEFTAAGHRAEKLVADLRDTDSAKRIVAAAVDSFGAVHGLVNNAVATNEPKRFVDLTLDDMALDHEVGPRATLLLMQAVHPLMVTAGGGAIVNLRLRRRHRRRTQVGRIRQCQGSHSRPDQGRRPGVGPRQHPSEYGLPICGVRRRQDVEGVQPRRLRQGAQSRSAETHRRRPHRHRRSRGIPPECRRDLHHRADDQRRRRHRLLPLTAEPKKPIATGTHQKGWSTKPFVVLALSWLSTL